jgi:hypothetical protein
LESARQRSQVALIDFLNTEVDLGLTLLKTADLTNNPTHGKQAVAMAIEAVATVRLFQDRIRDPAAWRKIQTRTDDLASRFSAYEERGES